MMCTGCTASQCIVQEWVDFDVEMRLFFLPPVGWPFAEDHGESTRQWLEPARVEWNDWSEPWAKDRPRGFRMLSKEQCMGLFGGDEEFLDIAQKEAVERSQFFLAWLLA